MLWERIFDIMKEIYDKAETGGEKRSIKDGCYVFISVMEKNHVFTEEDTNSILNKMEEL